MAPHVVTDRLFGGNYVRGYHAPTGPFAQIVPALGITHLRYPGGGVTEDSFYINRTYADGINNASFNTGLGMYQAEAEAFLDMAATLGLRVTLVVPTRCYEHARFGEVVTAVIGLVNAYPGTISTVEIGNERYASGQLVAPYAAAANLWLDATKTLAVRRAIQSWPYYTDATGAEATELQNSIAAANRPFVDAVTIHQYIQHNPSNNYDKSWEFDRTFWFPESLGYPRDIERLTTEWGVYHGTLPMTGFEVAAPLVRHFDQIVRNGMDEALIWPVAHRHSNSDAGAVATAGWNNADQHYITPAGIAFQQLHELIDLERISGTVNVEVNQFVYAGAGKAVLVVTNQGPQVTVPLTNPSAMLPLCTKSELRQLGWGQNSLIWLAPDGQETEESGAALGTLTVTPVPVGQNVNVTLPPNGVAFFVAEAA